MNLHEEPIPAYIEPLFLKQLAEITQPWGFGPSEDPNWNTASVAPDKKTALREAVSRYDAELLNRERMRRLEELADVRRTKEVVGPMGLVLDDKTATRLGFAALRFMRKPDLTEVRWEVTRGVFHTLSREQVLAMFDAMGDIVQGCFDRVSELTAEIMATTSLEELEAIDLTTGWPS